MPPKAEKKNNGFDRLRADLKAQTPQNVYLFYGEETYLRSYYLEELHRLLIPAGFEEFNYHRLSGKGLTVQELAEVTEAMPMMAQHTMVVVTDLDIFRLDEQQRTALMALLADFPEYCTLVLVYDLLPYKRDGKMKKLCAALDKSVCEVEFRQQERAQLLRWVKRRFAAAGHDIDDATADHLLFTCGSLMTELVPEIGKIAAYAKGRAVTVEDINAVADPVLDARVFDMTNSITAGKYDQAAQVLGELLRMQTEPIVILEAAVYGPDGAGCREGPVLAQAAVEHELRLSRQAVDAGGRKGGSRMVSNGGHPMPEAGSADEKREEYGQRGGAEAVPHGAGRQPVKPRVRQVIVVEGRYDKNALSQVVDAVIVETGGFSVFHDREKLAYLRRLAAARGVILMTDPDGAGFVIRNHLKGVLPPEQILQAYVPDVYGKERRKRKGGKEGKLGVEGMPPAVLLEALRRCGATWEGEEAPAAPLRLTKADLLEKGLIGPDSAARRQALCRKLSLPERMTSNALLQALNTLLTEEEWAAL